MSGYLEPAHSIITKLGGLEKTAEVSGASLSRVCRWRLSISKGGTGGRIPGGRQERILAWARKNKIKLGPADFFVSPARSQGASSKSVPSRQVA